MKNKVIVITGGAKGFGLAMASTFLYEGCKVAILDIDINKIKVEYQDYIESGNLYITKCDVTNPQEISLSISQIISLWQKIDILINNAALAIFELFEHKSIEKTQNEFNVNYFGYLRMIKEVFPHMQNQGGGMIYNVSSGVGLTGFQRLCGYTSTKGAIESLTKTLALEFKTHNIKIGIIHPPLMHTESSLPLGIPVEIMKDPQKMGQSVAKKILNKEFKKVITPNLSTSIFTGLSYRYPKLIGSLLDKATNRELDKRNLN